MKKTKIIITIPKDLTSKQEMELVAGKGIHYMSREPILPSNYETKAFDITIKRVQDAKTKVDYVCDICDGGVNLMKSPVFYLFNEDTREIEKIRTCSIPCNEAKIKTYPNRDLISHNKYILKNRFQRVAYEVKDKIKETVY